MIKRHSFLIIVLFILSVSLKAEDIYIYNFDVGVSQDSDDKMAVQDDQAIDRISLLYQKAFSSFSSDTIAFKVVSGQVSNKVSGTIRTIKNTVNALAVCFFYNIDYVLYGNVFIDKSKNFYTTELKVYGKNQDDNIFSIRYSKAVVAGNEAAYVKELASIVAQQLPEVLRSLPPSPAEKKKLQLEEKQAQSEAEAQAKEKEASKDEKLMTYMEKILNAVEEKKVPGKAEEKSDSVKIKKTEVVVSKEKLFCFYVAVGYYFEFLGIWHTTTLPLTTVAFGPKLNILLYNSPGFHFYLQPSLLIDYALAMENNQPNYNYYVRINSMAIDAGLDFFFEFGEIFGFSIGGGALYDFDFVVFREYYVKDFYAYTSFGLGAFVNLELDFVLGKEKNFLLGINNMLNFVFYDQMTLDYKIQLALTFKV